MALNFASTTCRIQIQARDDSYLSAESASSGNCGNLFRHDCMHRRENQGLWYRLPKNRLLYDCRSNNKELTKKRKRNWLLSNSKTCHTYSDNRQFRKGAVESNHTAITLNIILRELCDIKNVTRAVLNVTGERMDLINNSFKKKAPQNSHYHTVQQVSDTRSSL